MYLGKYFMENVDFAHACLSGNAFLLNVVSTTWSFKSGFQGLEATMTSRVMAFLSYILHECVFHLESTVRTSYAVIFEAHV